MKRVKCPNCGNDDARMLERMLRPPWKDHWYCEVCGKTFEDNKEEEEKEDD